MNDATLRHDAIAIETTHAGRMPGLAVVRGLICRLHQAGLPYCHWKSNEHLGPAVEGVTDLDMLFGTHHGLALQRILAESGYKRFAATGSRGYPAVEDYLGFDEATGTLSHLHLHYQLTVGQAYLKGYRLPWEEEVLATRTPDAAHDVFVADPAMELVLLVTRAALKQRFRDRFRRPSKDFRRELLWLIDRADAEAVCGIAARLISPEAVAPLRALLAEPEDEAQRRRFARVARPALSRYRTYGALSSTLRALWREGERAADVINRRYLRQPVPLRRVSPRGGLVVVFLGSDGAGKSSLLKETTGWLKVKLDVYPVYFGSGNGPASVYRWPLQLARRSAERLCGRPRKAQGDGDASVRGVSRRRSVALLIWALTLSLEKRAKLRSMIRARNRGMVVLCDRYPQADVLGFNDGPLLDHLRQSSSAALRRLADWEARPYREAAIDPPDLVFKLQVAPEVANARRPEMNIAEIRRRMDAVSRITFPAHTQVIDLGNEGDFAETSLTIKQTIWDHF